MTGQATAVRFALKAMHVSKAGALLAPMTRGKGVIFTLHHVRPEPPAPFSPNRILTIRPQFLEQVITHVLAAGYDIVRLDEVPERLARTEKPPRSPASPSTMATEIIATTPFPYSSVMACP